MDEARPKSKSWKRDLARAVLLGILLVGLPAAGVAVAGYRKHIQACYWAWKWTRTSRGHGEPFQLAVKLRAIRAPHGAWVMACRLAYARAENDPWKYYAADALEIRDLYALVRQEGPDSPAEKAFKTRLRVICSWYVDDAELEAMGAEGIYRLDPPKDWEKGPQKGGTIEYTPLDFEFGSYGVGVTIWKIRDGIARPGGSRDGSSCYEERWVSVNRFCGPWRDLPPAPPRPPEPPDDEKLYKKL